jgi:hypothetical protein
MDSRFHGNDNKHEEHETLFKLSMGQSISLNVLWFRPLPIIHNLDSLSQKRAAALQKGSRKPFGFIDSFENAVLEFAEILRF